MHGEWEQATTIESNLPELPKWGSNPALKTGQQTVPYHLAMRAP